MLSKLIYFLPLLVISGLLGGINISEASAPQIAWDRKWGTAANEYTSGIVADGAGSIYVSAAANYIYKYDSNGNQIWTSQSSGMVHYELIKVGNYLYVVGEGSSNITGAKFDLSGNLIASYSYDYGYKDKGASITVDASGNVYLAGRSNNNTDQLMDRVVSNIIKFPAAGGNCTYPSVAPCTWVYTYNGGLNSFDYPVDLQIDASGTYLYSLTTAGTGTANLRFRKISPTTGSLITSATKTWSQFVTTTPAISPRLYGAIGSLKFDASGAIIFTVNGQDSSALGDSILIGKMDQTTFNIIWGTYIDEDMAADPFPSFLAGREIAIDPVSNRIYIAGSRTNWYDIGAGAPGYAPFVAWLDNASGALLGVKIVTSTVQVTGALVPGYGGASYGEGAGVFYAAPTDFTSSTPDYELIKFGQGCNGPISFPAWTDHPTVTVGVTPIKAVHITELRSRIDTLRQDAALANFSWTDPAISIGSSIRSTHVADLRAALNEVYSACGQTVPVWTDPAITAGATPVKAIHINELRSAVTAAP